MSRLRMRVAVRPLVAIAALVFMVPGGTQAFAAPGPTFAALRATGATEIRDVYIRAPQSAPSGLLQVLVALHGMGGNGRDFGSALGSQADANGWLIVAPTVTYGDWTNPDQITREDPALIAWLSDYISHLNERIGLPIQPRVLLFGHSRGAQLSLRFTEIHPEQVAGVAALSAGTYTLPEVALDTGQPLEFPFGVANLAQIDGGQPFNSSAFDAVPIWIGVGSSDTKRADVPDAWSPYIGPDRLQRAQNFAHVLQYIGADVSLTIFPNADHTLTDTMRTAGCANLEADISSSDA